ncbi:MAG: flagellar hook-associated protein FlgK [Opitutales bacterium]
MSGLFSALSTNARALQVHSLGAEVTGKNLANVNNPEYARQRPNITNLGSVQTEFGSMSMGLTVEGLSHSRDRLLDAALLREIGLQSALQAEYDTARQLETALGELIDRSDATSSVENSSDSALNPGLTGAINRFFNALDEVAASPTDPVQQSLLLEKAQALVDEFRSADARIDQAIADGTTIIQNDVDRVNAIFTEIANLNRQIKRFELHQPESAVDLRDKRQAALEELSGLVDFKTIGSDGDMQIVLTQVGTGADLLAVDGQDVVDTLNFVSVGTYQLGGQNVSLSRGSILGTGRVLTGQAAETAAQIDELAAELVTRVNAAYNPGGDPDFDFFSFAGTSAQNIALDSDLATNFRTSETGDASDATLILNTAKLAEADVVFAPVAGASFTGGFGEYAANIAAEVGSATLSAQNQLETQTLVTAEVRTQRDSVSGVSMDEEVANLVKYQRAFQASARVISVIDSLLETVVNLKR